MLVCVALSASRALAADPRDEAKTAYAAASHAFEAGDYVTAARELARADELVPNDTVLSAALDAVLKTDDALLGMELAERAGQRSVAFDAKVSALRAKFATRIARLAVFCEPDSTCEISIDGTRANEGKFRMVAPGAHKVVVNGFGVTHEEMVNVGAGEERKSTFLNQPAPAPKVQPTPVAPPPPSNPPPDATGISPTWFWIGAGVSAALAAGTVISYIDTSNLHDDFVNQRTEALRSSGLAAQTRTGVLLAVTGAAAVTTAAIGVFAVRWHSGAELHAQAGVGSAAIAGRF